MQQIGELDHALHVIRLQRKRPAHRPLRLAGQALNLDVQQPPEQGLRRAMVRIERRGFPGLLDRLRPVVPPCQQVCERQVQRCLLGRQRHRPAERRLRRAQVSPRCQVVAIPGHAVRIVRLLVDGRLQHRSRFVVASGLFEAGGQEVTCRVVGRRQP